MTTNPSRDADAVEDLRPGMGWKKARGILKDIRPGVPAEQLIREARDAMWGDETVERPFIEHQLAAIAYKIGHESTMERRCPELIEAYKELLKVYERTLDLPNNKPPDPPAR